MSAESHPVVIDVEDEEQFYEKKLNVDKSTHGEEAEEEVKGDKSLYNALCGGNILTALVVPALGVGAVFCLIGGILTLMVSVLVWPVALVAFCGSILSVFLIICVYGGMRYQLDRFKEQNARLKKTSAALQNDVTKLEETNKQLGLQIDKLELTVDDLQGVSDKLQGDLGQFSELREAMDELARETGTDIKQVIGDISGVYDRIGALTVENERILLQRTAQDLEFMDRDAAMSKNEFDRFIQRIPKHLQERFKKMGATFEQIAGEDGQIDHEEMKGLIDRLLDETLAKSPKK